MTGKQYKEAIQKRGLKQLYIAKQIGVHHTNFSKFLNGKLELKQSKIERLSELLNT